MRVFAPRGALARAFAAAARGIAAALAGPNGLGPREAGLIVGVGLVGYGAYQVYPPAGFLLPGAIIVYAVIAGLR